jgi:hypothetical protein
MRVGVSDGGGLPSSGACHFDRVIPPPTHTHTQGCAEVVGVLTLLTRCPAVWSGRGDQRVQLSDPQLAWKRISPVGMA